ncbi:GTP cyclohydrolase I FolE2 [Leifsonia flava]|uniref:GTP cyclohydrolase I FolE2 n=1 Tax=Orlajensenia leifsoniae TaxID=2561933 RepID=A0A4Y9QSK9_9MICO|nr:GTP cyclohydrolase, FolE2/MptA family [Leifsonia flava]TFV95409.1 GTP cyclohydrolase I FolE2 [Leifsonia flava]
MLPELTQALPDIQDEVDPRGIELDAVGVSGVRTPIRVSDGEVDAMGVGSAEFVVTLAADRRGTHMSRMVETLAVQLREFDPRAAHALIASAMDRLDASNAQISFDLAVPFEVRAPVSDVPAWQTADVQFSIQGSLGSAAMTTTLTTHVTSLCPCSKAISDYGAHNQRSAVTLSVTGRGDDLYPVALSDMFTLARQVGSCPIFPVIKRPDERWITMEAYDHPAFVEDMVRDLSATCRARGLSHSIAVRNFESIHSHDAVASLSWSPNTDRGAHS